MAKIKIRQWLEIRNEQGERNGTYCAIDKLLLSPEMQKRCVERRAFNRILRLIDEHPWLAKSIQDNARRNRENNDS